MNSCRNLTRISVIGMLLGLGLLVTIAKQTNAEQEQSAAEDKQLAVLQIAFQLASDFSSGTSQQRENVLSVIDERGRVSDQEVIFTGAAFVAGPDTKYRTLAPAEAAETYAYIRALHKSYARYRGALVAGDTEWASKQLKAAQEYAGLAAKSILAESQQDDQDVVRLQHFPFAVRRSDVQQAAFLEGLRKNGLSAEHLKLMKASGRSDEEIASFQQQLLKLPPDKIGASAVEMLSEIAETRRHLAAELNGFAEASPGDLVDASTQTFDVQNPHDRQETVDLFIRPISIPADWKLSIVNAQEDQTGQRAGKPPAPPKYPVHELDPGKHYNITLPAKAETKVASVVIPVGEVGARTTARWAVEGKIGNEMIGGMVHEMNVPYIIADLKLPPVGSKEEEEELPARSRAWSRIVAEVVAAIVVLGLLAYFFIFWRRRRRTGTSSPV